MTRQERDEWLREVNALMAFEESMHMANLNKDITSIMNSIEGNKGKK